MTADHAAIRARLDGITPGPWEIIGGGEYVAGPGIGIGYDEGVVARDADFIAHAPEDVRALLAENEALLAVIDAAPHGTRCPVWRLRDRPCDCWKSRARSKAQ